MSFIPFHYTAMFLVIIKKEHANNNNSIVTNTRAPHSLQSCACTHRMDCWNEANYSD